MDKGKFRNPNTWSTIPCFKKCIPESKGKRNVKVLICVILIMETSDHPAGRESHFRNVII